MRALVKSLLPNEAANTIRELREPWRRVLYPSWEAAERAAGDTYDSDSLNRFRVERAIREPRALRCDMLARCVSDRPIAVTDFGGNVGEHGNGLPNAVYTVVETRSLVRLAQEMLPGPIQFATAIPDACDVFFTSGTLQCVAEPYQVIRRGFETARQACIFVRNCFSESEIFRVHHSRLGNNGGASGDGDIIRYPHRTISENTLRQMAEHYGFSLIERTPNNDGALSYRGLVYGADLHFTASSRQR